jgi:hypothetical protein
MIATTTATATAGLQQATTAIMTTAPVHHTMMDEENVTLGRRKNQLSRHLRLLENSHNMRINNKIKKQLVLPINLVSTSMFYSGCFLTMVQSRITFI